VGWAWDGGVGHPAGLVFGVGLGEGCSRCEEGIERVGEGGCEFGLEVLAERVGELEALGGGIEEGAERLTGVVEEALSEGDGVGGEDDAVDQGVPTVGLFAEDGLFVAPHEAEVAEGAEATEVGTPDGLTGKGEGGEAGLVVELLIEEDQFPELVAGGVVERLADRRQFDGDQEGGFVVVEEAAE
jgi:hypothetical protein